MTEQYRITDKTRAWNKVSVTKLPVFYARVSTENHNSALKTGKGSSVWNRAGSAAVWRRLPERVGFRRMEKKSQRLRDRNGRM